MSKITIAINNTSDPSQSGGSKKHVERVFHLVGLPDQNTIAELDQRLEARNIIEPKTSETEKFQNCAYAEMMAISACSQLGNKAVKNMKGLRVVATNDPGIKMDQQRDSQGHYQLSTNLFRSAYFCIFLVDFKYHFDIGWIPQSNRRT